MQMPAITAKCGLCGSEVAHAIELRELVGTAGVITTCTACRAYGTEALDLTIHDAMVRKRVSTKVHMTYVQAVLSAIAKAKPAAS